LDLYYIRKTNHTLTQSQSVWFLNDWLIIKGYNHARGSSSFVWEKTEKI
jgi:hypothetical protein